MPISLKLKKLKLYPTVMELRFVKANIKCLHLSAHSGYLERIERHDDTIMPIREENSSILCVTIQKVNCSNFSLML